MGGDINNQMQRRTKIRELTEKIVSNSKVARNLDEDYYQADQDGEVEYYDEAEEEADVDEEAEYYEAEEDGEEGVEYYAEEDQEEEETEYYAAEDEEEDVQYYEEDGDLEEETYYNRAWGSDDEYNYNDLTFDLTQFSLKMHSCRSLTDFDIDSLNQEQVEAKEYEWEELKEISYPFSGVPYVNFRLCPTLTCHDEDWKGCRGTYGNYMISLEEYFQITETHLEEELEEYCDYCSKCNYFYKYFNATCQYYDECETYGNVCNDNGGDDGDDGDDGVGEVQYEDLFECTAVEKSYYYQQNNNRRTEEEEEYDENVYLKIFCDGSIKIGIFSDDECTNYIGQTTTIYQSTGMKILEDDLETDFMNHNCIHCGKSVSLPNVIPLKCYPILCSWLTLAFILSFLSLSYEEPQILRHGSGQI